VKAPDPRAIHHKADFAWATALAPPFAATKSEAHETDGLSRNADDFIYGCIDH
jgi:hypothetical protein